ncbi:erythromycin esterase family protein [Flagellimonas okinawensis]|uniref:Erythromycin esterase family protein n=1 Tax=Flagellimonas okinawensis TaxID=3031324 RepID=A0ABT5XQU3_9FLAO|nr:erythromycin esterase family protein [[Muricauda] okinawensis]MDF0708270.1 erythromycin esterase family protein [[Muricauda] okinawensis]
MISKNNSLFMRYFLNALIVLLFSGLSSAQVKENIYELNHIENLLTYDVEQIISKRVEGKRVVFLGEAEHHIGSDFLAKTNFVKYLVTELGYTEIAFESDFFGLYFEHDKKNIFPHWSRVEQCKELFDFLDKNNVTIWGFDNQTHSPYSYYNFTKKLIDFLNKNSIEFDQSFISSIDAIIKNGPTSNKVLDDSVVDSVILNLNQLLDNEHIKRDKLWHQFLESFKSAVLIYTTHSGKKKGIPIRDRQMAKNLDFLVNNLSDKKIIVWLANAHMAKFEYGFMDGETMGAQFVNLNPNMSYHIAVSSINMPYRKEKWIKKSSEDEENLLHLLPTTEKNYFIDSTALIDNNPEFKEKEFEGMFNLRKDKTNWFRLFDALVFISKGERIKYLK